MLGWANSRQLWVAAELVSPGHCGRAPLKWGRSQFPMPMPWGSVLSSPWWRVEVSPWSWGWGLAIPWGSRPSLLLQCPVKDRTSFLRAREMWGWLKLRMALWLCLAWFPSQPEMTWTTNINTDPAATGPQTQTWPSVAARPDNLLALCGSKGHSDQDISGSSMALEHEHSSQSSGILTSTCTSMITGALDINTNPDCTRVTDPDMVLSCSSAQTSRCHQVIQICMWPELQHGP